MVVMPRERWTDERLDKAFGQIDGDLRELRVEMRKGFEKIDQRFEEMDRRFEQVDRRFAEVDRRFERFDEKFDAMQRNMTFWFISLFSAIIASLISGFFAA